MARKAYAVRGAADRPSDQPRCRAQNRSVCVFALDNVKWLVGSGVLFIFNNKSIDVGLSFDRIEVHKKFPFLKSTVDETKLIPEWKLNQQLMEYFNLNLLIETLN